MTPTTLSVPVSDRAIEGLIELQAQEIARLRAVLLDVESAKSERNGDVDDLTPRLNALPPAPEQNVRISLTRAHIAFAEVSAERDALLREVSETRAILQALEQVVPSEVLASSSEPPCQPVEDAQEIQREELGSSSISQHIAEASAQFKEEVDRVVKKERRAMKAQTSMILKTSFVTLREERDRLQMNVDVLTADLTATRSELAQCREELKAAIALGADGPLPAEPCDIVSGVFNEDVTASNNIYYDAQADVPTEADSGINSPKAADHEECEGANTCLSRTCDLTTVQAMFTPFAYRALKSQLVQRMSKGRSVLFSKKADLLWDDCPAHGFLVDPPRRLTEAGGWIPRENSPVQLMHKAGKIELVVIITGCNYYIGTYLVGEPEEVDVEQFNSWPITTQNLVAKRSCPKPIRRKDISCKERVRKMYCKGEALAVRYPLQRIGYDAAFSDRLVQLAA